MFSALCRTEEGRGRDGAREGGEGSAACVMAAFAGEDSENRCPMLNATKKRQPSIQLTASASQTFRHIPLISPVAAFCDTVQIQPGAELTHLGQTSLGVRARWATLAGTQPQHTSHSAFWISWFLKAYMTGLMTEL